MIQWILLGLGMFLTVVWLLEYLDHRRKEAGRDSRQE